MLFVFYYTTFYINLFAFGQFLNDLERVLAKFTCSTSQCVARCSHQSGRRQTKATVGTCHMSPLIKLMLIVFSLGISGVGHAVYTRVAAKPVTGAGVPWERQGSQRLAHPQAEAGSSETALWSARRCAGSPALPRWACPSQRTLLYRGGSTCQAWCARLALLFALPGPCMRSHTHQMDQSSFWTMPGRSMQVLTTLTEGPHHIGQCSLHGSED